MRWQSILPILFIVGCTGSLTEEQRKAVKEDMESHAIRKVSDAQLTDAAFSRGREIIAQLEEAKGDSSKIPRAKGRAVFSECCNRVMLSVVAVPSFFIQVLA